MLALSVRWLKHKFSKRNKSNERLTTEHPYQSKSIAWPSQYSFQSNRYSSKYLIMCWIVSPLGVFCYWDSSNLLTQICLFTNKFGAHIPLTSILHIRLVKSYAMKIQSFWNIHTLTFWVIKLICKFKVLQAAIMVLHNYLIKENCMHITQ